MFVCLWLFHDSCRLAQEKVPTELRKGFDPTYLHGKLARVDAEVKAATQKEKPAQHHSDDDLEVEIAY